MFLMSGTSLINDDDSLANPHFSLFLFTLIIIGVYSV